MAGLGLAVVARIVEQLGGQLRVDSQVAEGSRFSFLIPLGLQGDGSAPSSVVSSLSSATSSVENLDKRRSRTMSHNSASSKIDSLVEALSSSHMHPQGSTSELQKEPQPGTVDILGSATPLRPVRIDQFDLDKPARPSGSLHRPSGIRLPSKASREALTSADPPVKPVLRILIVEVRRVNEWPPACAYGL